MVPEVVNIPKNDVTSPCFMGKSTISIENHHFVWVNQQFLWKIMENPPFPWPFLIQPAGDTSVSRLSPKALGRCLHRRPGPCVQDLQRADRKPRGTWNGAGFYVAFRGFLCRCFLVNGW